MKFLVDECLHTSLVTIAHAAGYEAYHVVHYGLQGGKDHELMKYIRQEEFVFVTNNASDFKKLFARERIHSGLIIIVPSTSPEVQQALFKAALQEIKSNEPINAVVEARLEKSHIIVETFLLFQGDK
jgi:predicted nuclease of predicted toxin-antitoxin system